MIIKIQRPLNTTERVPQALIYDKSRSIQVMIDLDVVAHLFLNGEVKVYHYARLNKEKKLVIGTRAPFQPW